MPRKAKETEEELDVQTGKKKDTFASRWFKDYAVNNADELRIVCELTARSLYDQFTLRVKTNNSEILAVSFYATFMEIMRYLQTKENKYKNYTIQIANSINIGYSNNDDENNEKVGNFMPIMEYINVNQPLCHYEQQESYRRLIDDLKDDKSLSDKDIQDKIEKTLVSMYCDWENANMKTNAEVFSQLKVSAFNKLKSDYHISLRSTEAVFPIFGTFMDNIVYVLKEKYKEAYGTDVSEVSINVLGLFDAFYSYDEDADQEVIEFAPNIRMKLALKNDSIADKEGN